MLAFSLACMQTYLERSGGAILLQGSDRHMVNNGEIVRFGSVRCRINFGAGHAEQVRLLAGWLIGAR